MANPVGRPLKFSSVEELQKKIDEYFEETITRNWTITGLALHLDTSRETLCNYESRDEYFDAIKRAKLKVENAYELCLRDSACTGSIFALKNFGWRDRQETDITSGGAPIVGFNFLPSGSHSNDQANP